MLICTVSVIAGVLLFKADVQGKILSQNKTKYYINFSEDLKKNDWKLFNGNDGKLLVEKSECIENPK